MAPLTVIAAEPTCAGKRVAVAITGSKRSRLLPDVPALSEVGIPGVEGDIWYGVFGPKDMAPEVVARLNKEIGDVMRAEEKSLGAQGFDAEIASAEEFRQLMVRDSARWAELIKAQGIKAGIRRMRPAARSRACRHCPLPRHASRAPPAATASPQELHAALQRNATGHSRCRPQHGRQGNPADRIRDRRDRALSRRVDRDLRRHGVAAALGAAGIWRSGRDLTSVCLARRIAKVSEACSCSPARTRSPGSCPCCTSAPRNNGSGSSRRSPRGAR
jgi:hypothetical protein